MGMQSEPSLFGDFGSDPARQFLIPILVSVPLVGALIFGGPAYAAAMAIIGVGGALFLANPKLFILVFLSLISLRNWVAGGDRIGSESFNFDLGGLVNVLATGMGLVYFAVLWKNPFKGRSLTIPYGLFLGIFAVSMFWAPDFRWAIRFTTRLGAPFFTYLVISDMLDRKMVQQVIYAIYASSIIPITYGFFQWITGSGNDITEGYNRVQSSFHHPAHFSMYLTYLFCLAYSELLAKRRSNQWGLLLYIGCLVALEISTYTRISWIAMAVCFVYLSWVYNKFSYILAGATVGVVVLLGFGAGIISRLTSVGDTLGGENIFDLNTSVGWRFYFWHEILVRFWDSPWIGFGSGSSTILGTELFGTEASPHNGYLRVLYETGAVGSAAFLMVLVVMLYQGFRLVRANISQRVTFISHVYVAMTATYILLNLTDNILEYYEVAIYHWAILSLVEYANVAAARAGLIEEAGFEEGLEIEAEAIEEVKEAAEPEQA
jgi:O-antigen ligase